MLDLSVSTASYDNSILMMPPAADLIVSTLIASVTKLRNESLEFSESFLQYPLQRMNHGHDMKRKCNFAKEIGRERQAVFFFFYSALIAVHVIVCGSITDIFTIPWMSL